MNSPTLSMAYVRHPEFLKQLGENIRRIREGKGLSQAELSYKTDISVNQISRIERGSINTGVSTLFEIATALEVQVKDLFDFNPL